MNTLISSLVLSFSLFDLTARAATPEQFFPGLGSRPAAEYVRMLDASKPGNLPDESCAELMADLANKQRLVSFRHWALGYLASEIKTNDFVVPARASLGTGALEPGPEYTSRLARVNEAGRLKIANEFLEHVASCARAETDKAFGEVVRTATMWMTRTYLPNFVENELANYARSDD